jgi:ArsR family transcriptional regulator
MSNNRNKNLKDAIAMAEAFKALSNPNRLKIFQQLLSCCTPGTVFSAEQAAKHCVGDLGNGLNIAPSTLSHHIKELSRAGLIQMERRGQHVDCWVDTETVKNLKHFFQTENK